MDKQLLKEAKDILMNLPPRRPSYFQLASMLVGREPTHQSKLWRILEEVRAKVGEMEAANDQIADYYDQIEIMKADLEDLKVYVMIKNGATGDNEERLTDRIRREAKVRMGQRRIDASFASIVKVREVLAAKQEEIHYLLGMFKELSQIEEVKPWDDEKSQSEFWEKKLGMDIALRNVLKLPMDLETIKTVLALPDSIGLKQKLHKSITQSIADKGIDDKQ